jgi:hypothetical protein
VPITCVSLVMCTAPRLAVGKSKRTRALGMSAHVSAVPPKYSVQETTPSIRPQPAGTCIDPIVDVTCVTVSVTVASYQAPVGPEDVMRSDNVYGRSVVQLYGSMRQVSPDPHR